MLIDHIELSVLLLRSVTKTQLEDKVDSLSLRVSSPETTTWLEEANLRTSLADHDDEMKREAKERGLVCRSLTLTEKKESLRGVTSNPQHL